MQADHVRTRRGCLRCSCHSLRRETTLVSGFLAERAWDGPPELTELAYCDVCVQPSHIADATRVRNTCRTPSAGADSPFFEITTTANPRQRKRPTAPPGLKREISARIRGDSDNSAVTRNTNHDSTTTY